MSADSDMAALISKVRALGALPAEVAKVAAPGVGQVVKESAAGGRSPNGEAWADGKEGQRVLVNAASAVECRVIGQATVQLRLVGNATGDQKVQSIQHWGTKRIPARPILPEAGAPLPKTIVAVLQKAADEVFEKKAGGSK